MALQSLRLRKRLCRLASRSSSSTLCPLLARLADTVATTFVDATEGTFRTEPLPPDVPVPSPDVGVVTEDAGVVADERCSDWAEGTCGAERRLSSRLTPRDRDRLRTCAIWLEPKLLKLFTRLRKCDIRPKSTRASLPYASHPLPPLWELCAAVGLGRGASTGCGMLGLTGSSGLERLSFKGT